MANIPTATSNPNAEVSLYIGAAMILFWWLTSLFGLDDPPAEIASAATTVVTGFVLLIGSRKHPA